MRQRSRQWAVVLAALFFNAGCTPFSQPAPDMRDYDLAYPPVRIEAAPLPLVLGFPNLSVSATHDREAIVFRPGNHQVGRYYYHRWATNPGDMIADLLARDFDESGSYRAVVHHRSVLAPDIHLSGEVEAIEEQKEAKQCFAYLRIRFLLLDRSTPGTPVLLKRVFESRTETTCGDPPRLVESLSKALAGISADLQRAVYDATRSHRF